jgi:acyl-ACP thioesterase
VPPDEFLSRPTRGRVITIRRHVGLGDVRRDATLRLDALARTLQDAADADAATASVDGMGMWLLRKLAMRVHRTPRLRADLDVATWCSGVGPRWAERRTDVHVGDLLAIETAALWVHVDPVSGAPARLPSGFGAIWGPSAGERRVSARLTHPAPPPRAARSRWLLRATDEDVVGHVNNSAYWAPVEEELARRGRPRVRTADIEFRSGLDVSDDVGIVTAEHEAGFTLWLCAGSAVRASALIGFER